MSEPIVVFEDWEKVLRETVPVELQRGYREAVVKFRYWLREKGRAATVEAFKEHLAWKQSYLPAKKYEIRRQALRWYWEKGKKIRGRWFEVGGQWSVVGGEETGGRDGGQPTTNYANLHEWGKVQGAGDGRRRTGGSPRSVVSGRWSVVGGEGTANYEKCEKHEWGREGRGEDGGRRTEDGRGPRSDILFSCSFLSSCLVCSGLWWA